MNLFETTLKLNGFPIVEAKRKLEEIQQINAEKYGEHIKNARKEIVDYHLKNNAFYKNFVGNVDTSVWENIPVLTKNELQIPLEGRLSKGFTKKNTYINKTSGSSGRPILFAKDKFSHAITWAFIMERFGWFGIDFNSSLQARYYGIPLDFIPNKTVRLKDFLSKRHRFSILDFSEKGLKKMLATYRKKPFEYINGYTSSIVLFAKYLKERQVVLREECPTLKVCIVTSEMLFDTDKTLLEKQLGVPVVNEYGCAEAGVMAFTNKKGGWEVDSLTLFVEIVNENNKPVPLGEEGKILVTSLHNKAHPFIRYEIGDFGALSKKSTLKKPILKKLTGRTNDFVVLPSGKKTAGMAFYVITKKIMEASGNIKEFKAIQITFDTFEINYVSDVPLSSEKIQSIKKTLEQFLEPGLTFNFNRKDQLERNPSGKLKQFVSLIAY